MDAGNRSASSKDKPQCDPVWKALYVRCWIVQASDGCFAFESLQEHWTSGVPEEGILKHCCFIRFRALLTPGRGAPQAQ